MIQTTKLFSCGAKIKADTCGTAAKKTIFVKVNCEMGLEDAKNLINQLDAAREWLIHAPKGCESCDHNDDCPEMEEK